MKIFKSLLLAIILLLGLAFPFLWMYQTVFSPSGGTGFASSVDLSIFVGFTFSYLFSVIFTLNLYTNLKRFIWILVLMFPVLYILSGTSRMYWWYPTLIIVFAFVLSEITKLVTKKIQSKKQKIS